MSYWWHWKLMPSPICWSLLCADWSPYPKIYDVYGFCLHWITLYDFGHVPIWPGTHRIWEQSMLKRQRRWLLRYKELFRNCCWYKRWLKRQVCSLMSGYRYRPWIFFCNGRPVRIHYNRRKEVTPPMWKKQTWHRPIVRNRCTGYRVRATICYLALMPDRQYRLSD